jgi:hypothetical protein
MGFEVFMILKMKILVFVVMTLYSSLSGHAPTNIPEELFVSILREVESLKMDNNGNQI